MEDWAGVAVLNTATGAELSRLELSPGVVSDFVWKPDGEELALLGRNDSGITLWSWRDGNQQQISAEELGAPTDWVEIGKVGYSDDGHSLWAYWYRETGSALTVWDIKEAQVKHTWSVEGNLLCFDTCGIHLLCGIEKSGSLMLYNYQTGEAQILEKSEVFFTAACFIGEDSVLANCYRVPEKENKIEIHELR